MKRILIALMAGVVVGSILTGLVTLTSANASGSSAQTTTLVQNPATATVPVPVAAVVVVPASTSANKAKAPHPEGEDPVLGTRKWGIRSSSVKGARGQAVTSDLHSNVENYESGLLTRQQSSELLEIFEDSRGVHRLISKYGGDSDDARYYVKEIDANEDLAGNSTPWVTATLRADFASPEGKRGIEMLVYRRKTDNGGLDNTPYVSSTRVSYVDSLGELSADPGYLPPNDDSRHAPDGLRAIRFKN